MKKRLTSFGYAFRGIAEFIRSGANARLQLLAAGAIIVVGFAAEFMIDEWIAVALCIGFVLAAEAFNTALEELANEVTEERRERIRKTKDMAAGAVLIAALTALTVAVLIFSRRF